MLDNKHEALVVKCGCFTNSTLMNACQRPSTCAVCTTLLTPSSLCGVRRTQNIPISDTNKISAESVDATAIALPDEFWHTSCTLAHFPSHAKHSAFLILSFGAANERREIGSVRSVLPQHADTPDFACASIAPAPHLASFSCLVNKN